jgi:GNAT superfamily N-acetyltransferase
MASLYAQYLMERTEDLIIEMDNGFATYRYLPGGKSVYIVDIYTSPDVRRTGTASWLADAIAKEAKDKGCIELLGSVVPSTKGSTASLQVLLGYGMTLSSAATDFIIFRKDL